MPFGVSGHKAETKRGLTPHAQSSHEVHPVHRCGGLQPRWSNRPRGSPLVRRRGLARGRHLRFLPTRPLPDSRAEVALYSCNSTSSHGNRPVTPGCFNPEGPQRPLDGKRTRRMTMTSSNRLLHQPTKRSDGTAFVHGVVWTHRELLTEASCYLAPSWPRYLARRPIVLQNANTRGTFAAVVISWRERQGVARSNGGRLSRVAGSRSSASAVEKSLPAPSERPRARTQDTPSKPVSNSMSSGFANNRSAGGHS